MNYPQYPLLSGGVYQENRYGINGKISIDSATHSVTTAHNYSEQNHDTATEYDWKLQLVMKLEKNLV